MIVLIDLFDVVYTLVVYITYNMGNRDLPDIYTLALGPAALRLRYIYQANPSCPCYNLLLRPYNVTMYITLINRVAAKSFFQFALLSNRAIIFHYNCINFID